MLYIRLFALILAKISSMLISYWSTAVTKIYIKLTSGTRLGKNLVCHGIPYLQIHPLSSVSLGDNLVLTSRIYNNSIGVGHRVIIKASPNAFLQIGDRTGISSARISCSHSIVIGHDVLIGADTLITDSDAHPLEKKNRLDPSKIKSQPILIGPNVFIGAKCIILKGTTIGDGAVIGAGSVVSGKIEPNSIYAGNPARLIRMVNQ